MAPITRNGGGPLMLLGLIRFAWAGEAGLDPTPAGQAPQVDHWRFTVAGFNRQAVTNKLKTLGVELAATSDGRLLRFPDPHGIQWELKPATDR